MGTFVAHELFPYYIVEYRFPQFHLCTFSHRTMSYCRTHICGTFVLKHLAIAAYRRCSVEDGWYGNSWLSKAKWEPKAPIIAALSGEFMYPGTARVVTNWKPVRTEALLCLD